MVILAQTGARLHEKPHTASGQVLVFKEQQLSWDGRIKQRIEHAVVASLEILQYLGLGNGEGSRARVVMQFHPIRCIYVTR